MLSLCGRPNLRNSMLNWRHSVICMCWRYDSATQANKLQPRFCARLLVIIFLIYLMHPPLHIHKHPHCKTVRTCSCIFGAYASLDLRSTHVVTAVDRGVERLPSRPLCRQVLGALQRPETCSRRLFPPREENKEVSSRTTCVFSSQYSQSRHNKQHQT